MNSKDNPAAAGSVVTVFMTGAGAMVPPIGDGVFGPSDPPLPAPAQSLYAAMNEISVNVISASHAPGQIAGLVRVNI